MEYKLSTIYLDENFSDYYNEKDEQLSSLNQLSHINMFVGANNSGKSRILRAISAIADYKFEFKGQRSTRDSNWLLLPILESMIAAMNRDGIKTFNNFSVETLDKAKSSLPNGYAFHNDSYIQLRELLQKSELVRQTYEVRSMEGRMSAHVTTQLIDLIRNGLREIDEILNNIPNLSEIENVNRVYIPILRGLRPVGKGFREGKYDDYFKERTEEDYFNGIPDSQIPYVFTGGKFYETLIEHLLGDHEKRRLIRKYEEFLSKSFFDGKPITLIPHQGEKMVVIRIGNEKDRPIYLLGDGLQSIIILTFLVETTSKPTWFFIEEPELHLHPGMQTRLMSYFNSASLHTFFLTTHSNHILDMSLDYEFTVFNFEKRYVPSESGDDSSLYKVEVVNNGDKSSLALLGVRNSSVFLVNATVWVEGVTDRWYIRQFLKMYVNHMQNNESIFILNDEDTHYSFVEYGGSNITHWSFLDYEERPINIERLCSTAIVIIDKDGDNKQPRKERLTEILGDRLVILPCQEVENLLPPSVIASVVRSYEGASSSINTPKYSDYRNRYLGVFIEDELLKNQFSRKGGYRKENGKTIKDKVGFCNRAIQELNKLQFSDLPQTTQEMTIKIYEFVVSRNHKFR